MTHVHKVVSEKSCDEGVCVAPETTSRLRKNFFFFK